MASPVLDIEPRYFGPRAGLFGCLHAPRGPRRGSGMVLCHAFGQEYMRAHRVFSLLARRLAALGFPVLRFDLHGCGDSAGEGMDGDVQRWVRDIASAIDEVESACGVTRVALVGLRLGASLAAVAATGRDDVEALVAWDPVVSGKDYLDDLRVAHRAWMEAVDAQNGDGPEALGFPITSALGGQLAELDMEHWATRIGSTAAAATLVVTEDAGADASRLIDLLRSAGRRVDVQRGTGDALGATPTNLGIPWLPIQTIQTMASWLSEVCS